MMSEGSLASSTGAARPGSRTFIAVANEQKEGSPLPEKYEDVVRRLEEVVKRLEGAGLTLEDSLDAFDEGIRLVSRGERLLGAAEKRIEQLLSSTEGDTAVPLEPLPAGGGPARAARPGRKAAALPKDAEEDVPF